MNRDKELLNNAITWFMEHFCFEDLFYALKHIGMTKSEVSDLFVEFEEYYCFSNEEYELFNNAFLQVFDEEVNEC